MAKFKVIQIKKRNGKEKIVREFIEEISNSDLKEIKNIDKKHGGRVLMKLKKTPTGRKTCVKYIADFETYRVERERVSKINKKGAIKPK